MEQSPDSGRSSARSTPYAERKARERLAALYAEEAFEREREQRKRAREKALIEAQLERAERKRVDKKRH
eukprot:3388827-Pleurochrysis_carterae.AAC.1